MCCFSKSLDPEEETDLNHPPIEQFFSLKAYDGTQRPFTRRARCHFVLVLHCMSTTAWVREWVSRRGRVFVFSFSLARKQRRRVLGLWPFNTSGIMTKGFRKAQRFPSLASSFIPHHFQLHLGFQCVTDDLMATSELRNERETNGCCEIPHSAAQSLHCSTFIHENRWQVLTVKPF